MRKSWHSPLRLFDSIRASSILSAASSALYSFGALGMRTVTDEAERSHLAIPLGAVVAGVQQIVEHLLDAHAVRPARKTTGLLPHFPSLAGTTASALRLALGRLSVSRALIVIESHEAWLTSSQNRATFSMASCKSSARRTSENYANARNRDYPRARGETRRFTNRAGSVTGLSPRSRGNHAGPERMGRIPGTIPALAGKPSPPSLPSSPSWDYPRARGETTFRTRRATMLRGLSPRSRGNRAVRGCDQQLMGTIPALAGKPEQVLPAVRSRGDYPRARGETALAPSCTGSSCGLSPRSRGNPYLQTSLGAL